MLSANLVNVVLDLVQNVKCKTEEIECKNKQIEYLWQLLDDIECKTKQIEYLWQLLDDIDTVGDMAKGDNDLYRRVVEKIQVMRTAVAESDDGYTLVIKPTFETHV